MESTPDDRLRLEYIVLVNLDGGERSLVDAKGDFFTRRKFITYVGATVAGVAGLYTFFPGLRSLSREAAESVAGSYLPIGDTDARYVRQLITKDSMTSRTIMWQSDAAEEGAVVEYRVKGNPAVQSVNAGNARFTDNNTAVYLHAAMLSGLASNTDYEYRVGFADKRDDWKSFKTAGKGAFKALIFPDSQSSDYSDWERIAQAARKANPDAAFFTNLGDLVDNGEDPSQWRAWFDSLRGIIDVIPCAPVLGNHETYNMNWKVRMPEAYLNLFSLPPNGKVDFQNQYYSFDYGDVHFTVLNTQFDEMLQFQPDLVTAQAAWLEQDLAQSNKKWKIVLMHKDVLTYEIKNRTDRKAGISDIGRAFMPIFDKHNVDVVLTGHLHTYRRRARLYDFRPDTRGPLYIVTGVAGNVRYPNLWIDHPFDQAVAPQPETDNYMTLEASSHKLRMTSFLLSGEKIDEVEIAK